MQRRREWKWAQKIALYEDSSWATVTIQWDPTLHQFEALDGSVSDQSAQPFFPICFVICYGAAADKQCKHLDCLACIFEWDWRSSERLEWFAKAVGTRRFCEFDLKSIAKKTISNSSKGSSNTYSVDHRESFYQGTPGHNIDRAVRGATWQPYVYGRILGWWPPL